MGRPKKPITERYPVTRNNSVNHVDEDDMDDVVAETGVEPHDGPSWPLSASSNEEAEDDGEEPEPAYLALAERRSYNVGTAIRHLCHSDVPSMHDLQEAIKHLQRELRPRS